MNSTNGAPKDIILQQGSLVVKSTYDVCKGCRNCFKSLTSSLAQNRSTVAVFISLPMLIMVIALIYVETTISTYMGSVNGMISFRFLAFSPLYVISFLTFITGSLALFALHAELQNLLGFAAFVYAAIGYWCVINLMILFLVGWTYLPLVAVGQFFLWISIPMFCWLFTSAIMDAHRILVTAAISARSLAAQGVV
jgi:hypothetical protein